MEISSETDRTEFRTSHPPEAEDLPEQGYLVLSEQMLQNLRPSISQGASWYSNWLELMLHHTHPFYEVAIIGSQAETKRTELEQHYHPNSLLLGSETENGLPLLENKLVVGETRIYVCVDKACQMPTIEVEEAVGQME